MFRCRVAGSGSEVVVIGGADGTIQAGPLTGFGAGEGYLVVPSWNRLTAWRLIAP